MDKEPVKGFAADKFAAQSRDKLNAEANAQKKVEAVRQLQQIASAYGFPQKLQEILAGIVNATRDVNDAADKVKQAEATAKNDLAQPAAAPPAAAPPAALPPAAPPPAPPPPPPAIQKLSDAESNAAAATQTLKDQLDLPSERRNLVAMDEAIKKLPADNRLAKSAQAYLDARRQLNSLQAAPIRSVSRAAPISDTPVVVPIR